MQKTRIIGLFICFFACWGAIYWFDVPEPAKHTNLVLSEIPLQLGEWTGSDTEIQDETLQVLEARSFINRAYRNAAGQQMSVHVALWHDEDVSECPHHPLICYSGAGWKLQDREKTTFQFDGREHPIELMAFERNGVRVVTGHWFQAGDNYYTSADSIQERLFLWNIRKHQFDRVKILLQSDRSSIDEAKPEIQKFAELIKQHFNEQSHAKNDASVAGSKG
jgi:EpsI family protein